MSAMDALEELLPGIEEFLVKALSRERLAPATEKKRLFFIERLDILKMPPSLPLRPTGLTTKDGEKLDLDSGIRDSYIAMQRALSRFCANSKNSPTNGDQDEGEEYDSVDIDDTNVPPTRAPPPPPSTARIPGVIHTNGNVVDEDNDDIYEIPVGQEDSGMLSDEFESTSYESYDDEEEEGTVVYENQDFHGSAQRGKSKKKKSTKARNESQEVIAKNLPHVIHSGELAQKGKLSWTRRYAAIQDTKLLLFKSEKEVKPVLEFSLTGYDAMYTDKDGKRHIMRLSQPGYETYWFSTDAREKADRWVEMINSTSQGGSGGSVHRSDSSSHDHQDLSLLSSETASAEQSSITNASLSGSEGGSGDGTVGSIPSPKHSVDGDLEKKLPLNKQKAAKGGGVMDSLSNFIGTFGRKKGKNVGKTLVDFDKFDADPDALISGLLTVYSDKTNKKWLKRWCVVKNGILEIYGDSGEETTEMTLALLGCEIQNAKVNKRQLAIRLVKDGKEIITLDTADTLEQGKWLGVLIKESNAGQRSTSDSMDYTYVDDDVADAPVATAESDDIYDEVYEDKITALQALTGSKSGSSTDGSGGMRVTDKSSAGAKKQESGEHTPPPLPVTAPPIHRVRGRKVGEDDNFYDDADRFAFDRNSDYDRNTFGDGQEVSIEVDGLDGTYENGQQIDDQIYENTEMFNNIKQYTENESSIKGEGLKSSTELTAGFKGDTEKSPSRVQQAVLMLEGATIGESDDTLIDAADDGLQYEDTEMGHLSLSKESERKDIQVACSAAAVKKAATEEDIVKCHSGPTIGQDKEILNQTENPILGHLRRQREERRSVNKCELDELRDNINQTRRKLAQLKKKRAEVRSKKLCSIDLDEKLKLGRELRQMDRDQDKIETELSKLTDKEHDILKEERAALRASLRGTSCTTSSSSRYTSTGSISSSSPSFSRTSWKHVEAPVKDTTSIDNRTFIGSSSPKTGSKFGSQGPRDARGPFASRYNDSFSRLSPSPTSSPTHSYVTKETTKLTTVRTVTTNGGGKSSTLSSYTTQRTPRPGLGARSATLPSKLEQQGDVVDDRPPSPRGGREKVQETLKLWESRTTTSSDC